MSVIVVAKILECVVHILRGVNIEEFSLSISDSKSIGLSRVSVFSEEGRNNWTIGLSIVSLEKVLVKVTSTKDR